MSRDKHVVNRRLPGGPDLKPLPQVPLAGSVEHYSTLLFAFAQHPSDPLVYLQGVHDQPLGLRSPGPGGPQEVEQRSVSDADFAKMPGGRLQDPLKILLLQRVRLSADCCAVGHLDFA